MFEWFKSLAVWILEVLGLKGFEGLGGLGVWGLGV